MEQRAESRFALWAAASIFLGAFLLFQVQPIISKMILPWFGGSPAVWTTAMLFFQTLLLAGYAYAHLLARIRWAGTVAAIHVALLTGAIFTLPITPSDAWKPTDGNAPAERILLLLTVNVGLPYFLLASTSPLAQAWFARALPTRSVYRLYALSNIGSLGALISYPLLVEPALTTTWQGRVWSGSFVVFALACGWLAVQAWRGRSQNNRLPRESAAARAEANRDLTDERSPVRPGQALLWLLAPAFASVMLLAITHHLTQDVAVVPFLWIVPLSLYLLTFIIAFDRDWWYSRRWCGAGAVAAILAASVINRAKEIEAFYPSWRLPLRELANDPLAVSVIYLAALFFLALICHGEAARARPPARHLTAFYLTIAAGGALGGALSALVFPRVFPSFWELYLGMIAGFALGVAALVQSVRDADQAGKQPHADQTPAAPAASAPPRRMMAWAGFALAAAAFFAVIWGQGKGFLSYHGQIARQRNFYGVLTALETFTEEQEYHGRALYHGGILHGYQLMEGGQERTMTPTTYYHYDTGVGVLLRQLPKQPRRIGVIGLGAGTLAAYGQSGDVIRLYEINPLVIEYATRYFTFLSDSNAERIEIVPGDARVSLENEPPQQFDILVIDAFSGDGIPTHLLTREAMAVYQRHLAKDGVIAFHISNRYLELAPVVAGLADHYDMEYALIESGDSDRLVKAPCDWALVTANQTFLQDKAVQQAVTPASAPREKVLWTDHFSNLIEVLK